jgi:hypothetical protein
MTPSDAEYMSMPYLTRVFVLMMLAALMPGTARSEDLRASHNHLTGSRVTAAEAASVMVEPAPFSPANLKRIAARLHGDRRDVTTAQRMAPRRHVMGVAIAIGIGAAVGATAIAASKYGANEGGEFCGGCFARWSAISIPVGAGAGAAVGYLIDRVRH